MGGAADQLRSHPCDDSVAVRRRQRVHPPLYEGSLLYMPTSPPGMSITEATRLLQVQDKLLRRFPEVDSRFGTSVGNTSTDNTPWAW